MALLGEYDNGSAVGRGRMEYIWLPTEDGNAIPIALYRNAKFFAIHTDHLGTPRLVTDQDNKPVWQWPYSAFGQAKPTGVLKATPNPKAAIMNPVLLKATNPQQELNFGFPGWYRDPETNTFYNHQRDAVSALLGRYYQMDPIGLAGGLNRPGYANQNPLSFIDPLGLVGESPVIPIEWGPTLVEPRARYSDICPPGQGAAKDAKGANGGKNFAGGQSREQRLRNLLNDDKVSSADRGWIKQEMNEVAAGKQVIFGTPLERTWRMNVDGRTPKAMDTSTRTCKTVRTTARSIN